MSDRSEFGFGFESTAAEVIGGIDLTGRQAIVTGGASGIGLETARALASAGADVTIPARDLAAGERAAETILNDSGAKVRVVHLDLADQASVRAFVDAWTDPLHILVANAGVMACPLLRTPEGWELFHRREYNPWVAYGQSKTANILFAAEADRRWAEEGIRVNSLMPGSIRTALQRHVDEAELQRVRDAMRTAYVMKTPEQGAATQILLAASPLVEGIGGNDFENCAIAGPHEPGTPFGLADYANDPAAAVRLWEVSAAITAA